MKPVWLIAAAVLVAFLVKRRHKLEPTLLAGGAIAAVGSVLYGLGLFELPHLDKVLEDVGKALGPWTYLLVAFLAFGETGAFIGLLVPGETAIIVGGVVAGQGEINLIALIAIVWACAVAGDLTSFYLGRRLGRGFLERHGPKVHITEERLVQVEGFFEKHGGKAVFLGRFVGLIRAVAPFLAGSSGMSTRRFLPYDVLGAGIWGTTFCVLGYAFWQSIDQVIAIAKTGAVALGGTITFVVAVVVAVRWLRVEENRDRIAAWIDEHAPFLRRLERPARFAWNRLTPGQLGLELTTLLSLAAVGSFVFFGYLTVLHDDLALLTPGDRRGVRWADALRTDWLDSLSKLVTHLGTLPFAGGALLLTAAGLLARRHPLEAAALVGGILLTYAGVHLGKDFLDRPRPPHPLVDSEGSAYPSGHAAYSVAWVAIAVAWHRVLPNVKVVATLVTVAVVVSVLVALSRVYLEVHWFSDVAGGLGLGVLAFSLPAMAALIVGHFRHNVNGSPSGTPSGGALA